MQDLLSNLNTAIQKADQALSTMKDPYRYENKIRNRKGYRTIKRPFISIDKKGKVVINKTACELLGLSPGDCITWDGLKPVKSENGHKLSPKLAGMQFNDAFLAYVLKVDKRRRFYLNPHTLQLAA